MSEIIKFGNPMMILADYKNPEPHKHLAIHLIISLGGEMEWTIENNKVRCRGIFINSDVTHSGIVDKQGSIVFLFTEISSYTVSLKKKYLQGNPYEVLKDEVVDAMLNEYMSYRNDKGKLDEILLKQCGLDNLYEYRYEERVEKVLTYISGVKTIEPSIVEDLSNHVYLSKSRLSHLFKGQTGMTLHSYLAFEKLIKTFEYLHEGMNGTEACVLAGFSSSSHCSSTFKRMFGISLRDINKTIKK